MSTQNEANFESEFIAIAQALVMASFLSDDVNSADRCDRLYWLAGVMTLLLSAAKKLPEDLGPPSAALQFAEEHLPEFAEEREKEHYRTPDWLFVDMSGMGDVEEFVDGEWRPENPYWNGLPSDKSIDLNLMAALRDNPEQTILQLSRSVNLSTTYVRTRLKALEQRNSVTVDGSRPARWALSTSLLSNLQRQGLSRGGRSRT